MNKAAEGYEPAAHAVAAIDDIASGKRSFWQLIYNGRERWSGRDFQICMHRMEVGTQSFISVTRFDLTEIVELRRVRDDFHIRSSRVRPSSASGWRANFTTPRLNC